MAPTAEAAGMVLTLAVGISRIARAIIDGGEARPNFDDGYKITRVLEAVERSSWERRSIRLV